RSATGRSGAPECRSTAPRRSRPPAAPAAPDSFAPGRLSQSSEMRARPQEFYGEASVTSLAEVEPGIAHESLTGLRLRRGILERLGGTPLEEHVAPLAGRVGRGAVCQQAVRDDDVARLHMRYDHLRAEELLLAGQLDLAPVNRGVRRLLPEPFGELLVAA